LGDTGGSASYHEGTGEQFSRVDHVHGAFDDLDPEPVGAYASPGTAYVAARRDHVHAGPTSSHVHGPGNLQTDWENAHTHPDDFAVSSVNANHRHPQAEFYTSTGDEYAHKHEIFYDDTASTGTNNDWSGDYSQPHCHGWNTAWWKDSLGGNCTWGGELGGDNQQHQHRLNNHAHTYRKLAGSGSTALWSAAGSVHNHTYYRPSSYTAYADATHNHPLTGGVQAGGGHDHMVTQGTTGVPQ